MATAQYLSDLAVALAERGHDVTVIASQRAYDDPGRRFERNETWRGVRIQRLVTTAFGKGAKWRRAADFASFILTWCWQLLFVPKPDLVVALTSPPLISFIGAVFARWRGARFVYWVMDLNPDEAIAAGWLREGSFVARRLHWLSRFSFRHAEKIIALDRFMQRRIEAKGIVSEKIAVIPPWSHDQAVWFDTAGRSQFRATHGLTDKFVVMYSGNHSPCHSLDTLMGAAERLAGDERFVFLFVGGGSEWSKIKARAGSRATEDRSQRTEVGGQKSGDRAQTSDLGPPPSVPPSSIFHLPSSNIICLPYQPLDQLAGSLSAADLQVVVMGDPFVGVIHPCKIYNILGVGAPVLCLGPSPSHLSEILSGLASEVCATVAHGEVDRCAAEILRLAALGRRGEAERYAAVARKFAQAVLLSQLVTELERA